MGAQLGTSIGALVGDLVGELGGALVGALLGALLGVLPDGQVQSLPSDRPSSSGFQQLHTRRDRDQGNGRASIANRTACCLMGKDSPCLRLGLTRYSGFPRLLSLCRQKQCGGPGANPGSIVRRKD